MVLLHTQYHTNIAGNTMEIELYCETLLHIVLLELLTKAIFHESCSSGTLVGAANIVLPVYLALDLEPEK